MHTTLKCVVYNIITVVIYFEKHTYPHTMILQNSTSLWWKNEMGANILFKNLIAFICRFILCLLAKLLHSPDNLCVCLQNVKVVQKNAKFLWGTQSFSKRTQYLNAKALKDNFSPISFLLFFYHRVPLGASYIQSFINCMDEVEDFMKGFTQALSHLLPWCYFQTNYKKIHLKAR